MEQSIFIMTEQDMDKRFDIIVGTHEDAVLKAEQFKDVGPWRNADRDPPPQSGDYVVYGTHDVRRFYVARGDIYAFAIAGAASVADDAKVNAEWAVSRGIYTREKADAQIARLVKGDA